jgi:hypothetical protein
VVPSVVPPVLEAAVVPSLLLSPALLLPDVDVSIACVVAEASVVLVTAVVSAAVSLVADVSVGRPVVGSIPVPSEALELVPLIEVAPVEVLASCPSSTTNHGLLVVHATMKRERDASAVRMRQPSPDPTARTPAELASTRGARSQGSTRGRGASGRRLHARRRSIDPDRVDGHGLSWAP